MMKLFHRDTQRKHRVPERKTKEYLEKLSVINNLQKKNQYKVIRVRQGKINENPLNPCSIF